MSYLQSLLLNDSVLNHKKHLIRFPRTDANLRSPANLEKKDFDTKDPPLSRRGYWRRGVGERIAIELNLPDTKKWKVAEWPEGYHHVEWDRDDSLEYESAMFWTRDRVYGSPGDFAPHALWLCLDPKHYKCRCAYCSFAESDGTEQDYTGVELDPPGPDPWASHSESWGSSAFMRVWGSCNVRQSELDPITFNDKVAQCLRQHEIVWFKLDEKKPITSKDGTMTITHWPVHISERRNHSIVDPNALIIPAEESMSTVDESENDIEFTVEDNVKQLEFYYVQFIGLRQETAAFRTDLVPFLGYQPPDDLLSCDPNHFDLHKSLWLLKKSCPRPDWHVALPREAFTHAENSDGRNKLIPRTPTFEEAIPAYMLAMDTVSYLSTAIVGAQPLTIDADNTLLDFSRPSSSQINARAAVHREVTNTKWILPKSWLWPEFGPLNAKYAVFGNTYYQGVMLGAERIWSGDVVRLELDEDNRTQIASNIANAQCGNFTTSQLDAMLNSCRPAVLMDIDAIMLLGKENLDPNKPTSDGDKVDNRHMLFCGQLYLALHRIRDKSVIDRYAHLVRDVPYDEAAFSLEWMRPRNTVLYTRKMSVSPDLAFLPVLERKKGFVAALPYTFVAGRWYCNPESVEDPKSELAGAHKQLADKVRAAPSSDTELPLTLDERRLVLEGWASGRHCAMTCRSQFGALMELHQEAELTAHEEVCALLECERQRRLDQLPTRLSSSAL